MNPRTIALSTAIFFTTSFAFAGGHGSPEDQAVGARNAQMSLISLRIAALGAMAKGDLEYDTTLASALAADLKNLADLEMTTLWLDGTDNSVHPTSRAAPAIWEKWDEFAAIMVNLKDGAAAIEASTDLAGLQAGLGMAGKACGDCHKGFRGPRR